MGALANNARADSSDVLLAPVQTSESGAAAFLGLTESGRRYWIKVPGNPQGDRILVSEQIVSAVGALIGAPVRPTALIEIGPEHAGWQYGEYQRLRPCVAHGSLLLEDAEVSDELLYARADDNARRQPALAALWDWCLGEDEQWLYEPGADYQVWSFDHGWWIGGAGDWTAVDLQQVADRDWTWNETSRHLDGAAFLEVADRLEAVTPNELIEAVCRVPAVWGVSDADLEAVAWMLHRRRGPVASRLRAMSAQV